MDLKWIEAQLRQRGVTQRELAEAIGLSEVQMFKVMKATRRLTSDEADNIRRFFGFRLPEDPVGECEARMQRLLSQLGDAQRQAVVLYLEALVGSAQ